MGNIQLLTTVTEQCREILFPTHPPSESARLIEVDTLEYQQTEKIETELKDVDRI